MQNVYRNVYQNVYWRAGRPSLPRTHFAATALANESPGQRVVSGVRPIGFEPRTCGLRALCVYGVRSSAMTCGSVSSLFHLCTAVCRGVTKMRGAHRAADESNGWSLSARLRTEGPQFHGERESGSPRPRAALYARRHGGHGHQHAQSFAIAGLPLTLTVYGAAGRSDGLVDRILDVVECGGQDLCLAIPVACHQPARPAGRFWCKGGRPSGWQSFSSDASSS